MKKSLLFLFLLFLLIFPAVASSHSGNTDIYNCHYCWTDCVSWGLAYGQYHCHGDRAKDSICTPYIWYDESLYNQDIAGLRQLKELSQELKDKCLMQSNSTYYSCLDRVENTYNNDLEECNKDCALCTSVEKSICDRTIGLYNQAKNDCTSDKTSGDLQCSISYDYAITKYQYCIDNTIYDNSLSNYLKQLSNNSQSVELCQQKDGFFYKNGLEYYDLKCEVSRDVAFESEIASAYKNKCQYYELDTTLIYNFKLGNLNKTEWLNNIKDDCQKATVDNKLSNRLKGKLLLQVEQGGRIWYIDFSGKKYEVTFANALSLFQKLAVGIKNGDLNKIPLSSDKWNSTVGNRLKGKLLLQVEDRGRIWYVDFNGKRREVTWANLMDLFKSLSLGITNADLEKIESGIL